MGIQIKKGAAFAALAVTVSVLAITPVAAQILDDADSQLTQQITAGVATTDIRDASGNVLNNPAFGMSNITASTQQQTSTGTFGSSSQRVTVDNPGGADDGWTLTWNVTDPGNDVWTGPNGSYDHNGSPASGQLTVNPAAGATNAVVGGSTGITLGSQASFTGSTPITLVTADATSADVWNGYFTGITLSQTIPAAQPVGSYTLNMTQTLTAI